MLVFADQGQTVVFGLVQLVPAHDHVHGAGDEQAEQGDDDIERQVQADHDGIHGSMVRIDRFSLKFCTAMEWPALIRTWPRCCSRAFMGTTKKPDRAPISISFG